MASERQVEANRKNAQRSSGPKTEAGKARSRANATKHGMAVESPEVEIGLSPEFLERRARWAAEQKPVGEAAEWALDRAVAASLRIERCERTLEDFLTTSRTRASLAWDEDRAAEAARLGAKLASNPALVSRELETSLAGVQWLIVAWLDLAETLEAGKDWSEAEVDRSLDLLGFAREFRDGRKPTGESGSELSASQRELAQGEVERLQQLRDEAMAPLDEMNRRMAIEGDIALLSKPAARILRYERDAWRRFRDSMAEVQSRPSPSQPTLTPPPRPIPAPVAEKPRAPEPSFEDERRAIREMAAPFAEPMLDELRSLGFEDEDAYLAELERRVGAWEATPGLGHLPPLGPPDAGRRNEPNFAGPGSA
jgi:hypothetical protein